MNVYVRQLAAALAGQGVNVDIFTRDHPEQAGEADEFGPGVRVVHMPGGDSDTPMDGLFHNLPGFLAEVQRFQRENDIAYQTVHSHYWLSGWVGRELARQNDIPHVVTFHTLGLIKLQSRVGEVEPPERAEVERELIASASRIVAFSPHERDAMVRLYGANAAKVNLVPCGVDLNRFKPLDRTAARERLGLNGGKVLLYVGRVEPLKGLELLVHTAAQMETCQDVKVLVVGGASDGDEEVGRLRDLAKDLEVDQMIDFVGRVDQEELPYYYNAADVCVVPSYYESFGLAALESMACGTPVVATRVGGLSTVVHHGHTGYLKSWRCPEAFANSLEMIISSEGLQDSMGKAARKRAEAMSWERVAAGINDIYRSVLSETSSRRE
ncbi:MAG: glycosyltransferase [Chloroflexi bacterium]|nr:glycosyltransferase [Chloroflexota bacterium]